MGLVVPGCGPKPCDLMLIGERPGKDERTEPFQGIAGLELNRLLSFIGVSRKRAYLTNLVKDYEDRDPEPWEIDRDMPELIAELSDVEPKTVVTLGLYSTRFFMPDMDMEMCHGYAFAPTALDNAITKYHNWPFTVFPVYHPALGLHDINSQSSIRWDFERLGRWLEGEDVYLPPDKHPVPAYTNGSSPTEISDYVTSQHPLLQMKVAIDTEGHPGRIWGMSWSYVGGTATVSKDNKSPITRAKGKIVMHHSLHDLPILEEMGMTIDDDQIDDTMVKAYNLCLHPQGLKPLAFRLAGMRMMSYDDVIGNASKLVQMEWLHSLATTDWGDAPRVYQVVNGEMKEKRPWSFNRRLIKIINDFEDKGFEVDPKKRWDNIGDELKDLPIELYGDMPEASLDDIDPQTAIKYAGRDADATNRVDKVLDEQIDELGLRDVYEMDIAIIPMVARMMKVGMLTDVPHFEKMSAETQVKISETGEKIDKIAGYPVNPRSGDQIADLLFNKLKIQSRRMTKGKTRPSTNDKTLEAIRKKHPVVPLVTDYRELSKLKNDFFDVLIRKSKNSPDHRVHADIGVTRVTSGRLSSKNPNLLAIPVRTEAGQEVRRGFIAPDGMVIGDWDFDQIEMRVMADESGDADLIRMFIEDRDVHSETASRMFGISVDQVDPKKHRYPAKRVGFGVITGITGMGLAEQMALAGAFKEDGSEYSEKDCDALIKEWFAVYPEVKVFMSECRALARRHGYIRDRWGRIRYLGGVYSAVERIREESMRQSHSHIIQAGAQGIMKRAMKAIWKQTKEWWSAGIKIEWLLQVHDELVSELDPDYWDLINHRVVEIMCETTALKVPIKAKGGYGRSWADAK